MKKKALLFGISSVALSALAICAIMNPSKFNIKAEDNYWWINCDMPEMYTSISDILDSGVDGETYTTRGTITSIEGNNLFIQSRNRGVMIYAGSTSYGSFSIGNVVDVVGEKTTYNGLVELKPSQITLYNASNPTPVEALEFSSSEFSNYCTRENVGRLVKVNDLPLPTFSSKNVTFTVDSKKIAGYINYGTASTVANEIKGIYEGKDTMDFTGILSVFNTTYQLRILGANDFSESSTVRLVTSISVTPEEETVTLGSSLDFEATVLPSNATNKTVNWSISDIDGISPTFSNGHLTADKLGTYTVTCSSTDGSGVSGSTTVTIIEPSAAGTVVDSPIQNGDILGPLYLPGTADKPSLSFLEMVYQYGDSVLFDYGDFEMLIDAGQADDADNVMAALSDKVDDGQLEVLIVTHPHSDHFGGIQSANTLTTKGGINNIKYIVDFGGSYSSSYYRNYVDVRNEYISRGATYYNIYSMIHNSTSGYPNEFIISNDVNLKFLDTGAYVAYGDTISSTYANESSVSCLLTYGNNRVFLCGDITGTSSDSEYDPEGTIVDNYNNTGLWDASTYNIVKANHHCSNTHGSNGSKWINAVKPDLVIISAALIEDNRTIAGPTESQHPTYGSLKRYLNATDEVYCNMINGTITVNLNETSEPNLDFAGRTLDYYDSEGNLVSKEAERTIKFKDSVFASIRYTNL